jgi:hypothetical protein
MSIWKIGTSTSQTPWVTANSADITVLLTLDGLDLGVSGLFGGGVKYFFGGALAAGRLVSAIRYPRVYDASQQNPGTNSVRTNGPFDKGIENLNTALHAYPGQTILVAGHSMGAQIVGRWMERYAGKPGAPDPTRTKFILFGNPERKYNARPNGTGHVTATASGYTTVDCKIQYDHWADYPDEVQGVAALSNINSGQNTIHEQGYVKSDMLMSPKNLIHTEGNTTFMMIPGPAVVGSQESIEQSYTRPENTPIGSSLLPL